MSKRETSGSTFLDDDIDYDFEFDDEPAAPSRLGTRGGKSAPYKPARMRRTPNWSRILVAGAVAGIVLFLVFLIISSIFGARKNAAYRDYFNEVDRIVSRSDAQGEEMESLLTEPAGTDRARIVARIDTLSGRADKLVKEAREVEPPKAMSSIHDWLVMSLDYRANGLDALQKSLTTALGNGTPKAAAPDVAASVQRLLASDVVYGDSYATAARAVLAQEDVDGAKVPESVFLKQAEWASPAAVQLVLERLDAAGSTAATKGKKNVKVKGVQGTQLTGVSVSPSGQTLSAQSVTEIEGSGDTAIEVTVQNGGEAQQTRIPVTITLRGDNTEPKEYKGEIESVDPGESATAKIAIDDIPTFGDLLQMTVSVAPVVGEKITTNNSGTYSVMFKL